MTMSFEPIFDPAEVPLFMDATGTIRLSRTRVTLDTIIGSFLAGESPEELADNFPTVPRADIYAVISAYYRHQAELDEPLERRRTAAEEFRSMIEADPSYQAMRVRILARKAEMEAERHAAADRG